MSAEEKGFAEEAERYRSLFAYSPQGVFSLDLEGSFADANAALFQLVGRNREELLSTDFARVIHPDDLAAAQEAFAAVLERAPQQLKARFVVADGGVRDVKITAVPVIVAGEVVGVHGITEDVTESNRMYRDLEEANAAKTLFLANVSHEVRTPLTVVLAATELLSDAELGADEAALVDKVHRGSQRLLRLVNDILDFSRLEVGRISLNPAPFRLASVVEEVLEWAVPKALGRSLELTSSWDPALPERVNADSLRISQVLSNLVDNALKFTETGTVHIEVRLHHSPPVPRSGPRASGIRVEFIVTDTGAGFGAEHLETLFESFTQADPSATRSHAGVGLGLAICRDLVALMGGDLDAVSILGQGSTFTFVLPLVVVDDGQARP